MAKFNNEEWNEEAYNKLYNTYNQKSGNRIVVNSLDKKTALEHPEFATSMFEDKLGYLNAQDKNNTAKMQEYNNALNMTRRQHGYTLGSDGNTPTLYNDPKLDTSISTQKPADYVSKYKNKIDSLYNTIANSKFSYDVNSDPSYQAYKAAYVRDGNRAMQDTLGEALGSSGFAGSSYANTAATQANDYYMSQLNDKVPELYQQAYARYQDELANKNQNLNTLMNLENNDYSRYRDLINDYNNDREFEWNQKQAQYAADRYTSDQQKNDARYEANQLTEARQNEIANQLAREQMKNDAKAQEMASLLDWFKVKGYGYDPTTGGIVQGLDYTKTMGVDQFGNPTLDNLKYQSDDYNTKTDLAIKDYTARNNAGIGWANAQTNRNNAETNRMNAETNKTNATTNRMKATSGISDTNLKNSRTALDRVVKNNSYTTLDMNGKQITKNKLTDNQVKQEQALILKNLYDTGQLTAAEVTRLTDEYGLNSVSIK